ncbi:MAG: hypothetical protein IPM17_07305 [Verrucomicrobia bacterium]|jgi:hypothetical protein|nr:hypothetical protein [Verrucomicrobiota bacterium]
MHTMTILRERGHLLVRIDNRRAIVDTGSPISMSPEPFEFLGQSHSPPTNIMGVTPQKMSALSGIQIDILIGCHILSQHTVRFRWKDGLMDVGDDIPESPISAELSTLMGTPIFPLCLQGRPSKALFDTGAHLSYIDPDLVAGTVPVGERDDFYPFIGHFTAPIYRIPTALDDYPLEIEYGTLPESLQMMLGMAMRMSNSSAVIGTQLLEVFDCTISWTRRRISWRRN